jgi:RNA polymerase sigma-70 factor (ECF subfamily)
MLVLDFQAGHPEAFVEIHQRYGGLIRHVCQKFLPNGYDADEAFQETMIRVYQGLHRFNGRYALQPWVARIATNVSLDQIRMRARRPQVDDGPIDLHEEHRDPADGPEELVERLVQRDLVLSVLSDLPESHRTALVLRELEGRSHREIGEALEISPSQAKALIHRAKQSFRRSWLRTIADRGGVMGIAMIPLLWVAKGLDGARRVVDRVGGHAGQVAQAATPEIVTSAASSPAVTVAASSVGERLVAAGMTLLVAGGVTVGAATLVKKDANEGRNGQRAVAAPVVPEAEAPVVPETATPEETIVPERPNRDADRGRDRNEQAVEEEAPVEEPVVDPTTDPGGVPIPPVDGESPSPDPTDGPPTEPPPPSAPAWTYNLTSSTESVEACDGCAEGSTLVFSNLARTEESLSFSQGIRGPASDSVGDPTWPFSLQQWGVVGPEGGQLDLRLRVLSIAGPHSYMGNAVLVETIDNEDGSTLYRFEGSFRLSNPELPATGLPGVQGFFSATVSVWQDGTVYAGSLTLSEPAAA